MDADVDKAQTLSLSSTFYEKRLPQTTPITHSSTNVEGFVATAGALANTGQKTAIQTSSHLSSHEKGGEIRPDQTPPGTGKKSNPISDETDRTSCISTHDFRGAHVSAGTDVDHPQSGGVTGPDQAETDVDHPRRPAFRESQNTFVTIGTYLFSYIFTKSIPHPKLKIIFTTVLFCRTLQF